MYLCIAFILKYYLLECIVEDILKFLLAKSIRLFKTRTVQRKYQPDLQKSNDQL